MKRLFFTAFFFVALACTSRGAWDTKVELTWEKTGGPIIAVAGEQKFTTLAELEQYLAMFKADSEVKLVYFYGPLLLGKPKPDDVLGRYIKAVRQFCSDHHLILHERAIGG